MKIVRNSQLLYGLILLWGLLLFSCSAPKIVVADRKLAGTDAWKLREMVLSKGMEMIGTPYKRAGKNTGGFDCSGLIQYLFIGCNIAIGPSSKDQMHSGKEIKLEEAQPGDLIFFGIHNQVNHVAMITGTRNKAVYILHSTSSKGVIQENLFDSDYWLRRIMRINSFVSYLPDSSLAEK
ncbi:MAG: C40 family peptidase [Saprospiraceae bacterium]|nr:C40 family peptidase [Saprospiraceae bacterium]